VAHFEYVEEYVHSPVVCDVIKNKTIVAHRIKPVSWSVAQFIEQVLDAPDLALQSDNVNVSIGSFEIGVEAAGTSQSESNAA
jgi:hypothetical protein